MQNYNSFTDNSTLIIGYTAEDSAVFDAGKTAFTEGKKRKTNPHIATRIRNIWFDGYDLAHAAAKVASKVGGHS